MSFRSLKKSTVLEGPFVHMVFFWLKEPENDSSRKKFVTELKFIDKISAINRKHIGNPADTDRTVVDSTYTYSLVLSFNSRKKYDIYADHPLHLTFIENASDLWEKVQVYDSTILNS
ncbi:MAG: Dabb family protein [Saprospiraceae bacterium]|nr:Dabb family protein [Saprospiraceae bacterium]